MDNANTRFDPDLIHAIFKLVWSRTALEREKNEGADPLECEVGAATSKKNRPTSEAVERAATIAEAEGVNKIEATHLERILPQLLLDF
ncbi:protein MHF2 homolog isoform X2 [Vitis vinifera]|uniref:protein MHF2 homolog isoform X2 n=1 Tax=Vitis vinifera TaxID=29760 RepID=UPI00053FEE3E|nr:protein MHF2 homolog isoform X2 [Vitis vinifera]|eukprot:XP_010663066.1 PREDICTED: uncharacterized protein LOC100253596 isoform X3 [Vitis vinifera]